MAVRGFFPDDVDICAGKQNQYALVCSLRTAYSQAMENTLSLCLCWDSNASGDSHHDGRGPFSYAALSYYWALYIPRQSMGLKNTV